MTVSLTGLISVVMVAMRALIRPEKVKLWISLADRKEVRNESDDWKTEDSSGSLPIG